MTSTSSAKPTVQVLVGARRLYEGALKGGSVAILSVGFIALFGGVDWAAVRRSDIADGLILIVGLELAYQARYTFNDLLGVPSDRTVYEPVGSWRLPRSPNVADLGALILRLIATTASATALIRMVDVSPTMLGLIATFIVATLAYEYVRFAVTGTRRAWALLPAAALGYVVRGGWHLGAAMVMFRVPDLTTGQILVAAYVSMLGVAITIRSWQVKAVSLGLGPDEVGEWTNGLAEVDGLRPEFRWSLSWGLWPKPDRRFRNVGFVCVLASLVSGLAGGAIGDQSGRGLLVGGAVAVVSVAILLVVGRQRLSLVLAVASVASVAAFVAPGSDHLVVAASIAAWAIPVAAYLYLEALQPYHVLPRSRAEPSSATS